ncbi:MAG TPA: hypothetical protein PKD78_06225, partial [Saprospiraceae bacterium]|nr:hypothetical protein [Saprospiraceae bacterium]
FFKVMGVSNVPVVWYGGQERNVLYYPDKQLGEFNVHTREGADVFLRMKVGGEVRQMVIPRYKCFSGSTIVLEWDDFQPLNTVKRDIEWPTFYEEHTVFRSINLVSPDFSQFMPLEDSYYFDASASSSFVMPANIPSDWLLHVAQRQADKVHMEELVPLNSALSFSQELIKIDQHSIDAQGKISVRTSGPVHLLAIQARDIVSFYLPINWTIQGAPKYFASYSIPRLEPFLPLLAGRTCRDVFSKHTVIAYCLPGLDYPEIARGYPWKYPSIFPRVQNGRYRELWSN